jgi:hypothetical protein
MKDFQTNKVYWGLWLALAIFWIIGFAYYSSKLDAVVFDGYPFYAEVKPQLSKEQGEKILKKK